ncbi:MAG: pantoate--beta-alanine ligase [Gemmataceae bacterium]
MSIPVVNFIPEARSAVAIARQRGDSIALVPTMGALHEGHASLIRRARDECGYVVVWIFVNPTQFGPNEDFTRYPRTLTEDVALCAREDAGLVFAPPVEEVYPSGFRTSVHVRDLGKYLCGPSRPGHFDGVATVVLKMFTMVGPNRAYFGRKDAQQLRIVQQLVRDLDLPVEIVPCDTVREPDGLAMSSRNRYLDATQRANAPAMYRTLCEARDRVVGGERDAGVLRALLAERITAIPGAAIDYAEVVDADSFHPVSRLDRSAVAALAVKFGATRLIDNIDLTVSDAS